ncbi:MAG: shikimate dehydrogenase [Gammaproteobacteria bacterium]
MDLYAVLGSPVAHSRSPFLFAQFAAQTQQVFSYEKIETTAEQLPATLIALKLRGGKGVNITAPLKEIAFQLAHETSARAKAAQAVNVLCFKENGEYYGDNVDGVGLVRDLKLNLHIDLKNKRILVIGAGGAVRGVLHSLLEEQPEEIVITNRTPEKAELLASQFKITSLRWDELPGHQFDLIINGTSVSRQQVALPLPNGITRNDALCYDMVYGVENTSFQQWAEFNHARHVQGLGMLVEQAAETFYLWRGVRPETVI